VLDDQVTPTGKNSSSYEGNNVLYDKCTEQMQRAIFGAAESYYFEGETFDPIFQANLSTVFGERRVWCF